MTATASAWDAYFREKLRLFLPLDITGSFSDTATSQRIVRAA